MLYVLEYVSLLASGVEHFVKLHKHICVIRTDQFDGVILRPRGQINQHYCMSLTPLIVISLLDTSLAIIGLIRTRIFTLFVVSPLPSGSFEGVLD